jgi:hypothetical protein
MSQTVGTADRPKIYQPVNPAPDPRSAPTSTSTGVSSDNGGQPEQKAKQSRRIVRASRPVSWKGLNKAWVRLRRRGTMNGCLAAR